MRTPVSRRSSAPKGPSCHPRTPTTDSNRRVCFTDTNVSVYGWPSRGGIIVLDDATHVDFTFLSLSTTKPPLTRLLRSTAVATTCRGEDEDQGIKSETVSGTNCVLWSRPSEGQEDEMKKEEGDEDEEDVFCQRLLLLGAKWWDDEKRYQFVDQLAADFPPAIKDIEEGRAPDPTLRERRWIKVGWEPAAAVNSGSASAIAAGAGFWILDCDTNWIGIIEEDNLVPIDAAKVELAKNMGERCEILQQMGG